MTVEFYLTIWDQTYQEGLDRGLSEKLANIFADNFAEVRVLQMLGYMGRDRSHDH